MIRKLRFKNFCSFRERTEVDFASDGGTPDASFVNTPGGERFTTVLGVTGGGASGKTNLLKALVFLPMFMRRSFNQASKAEVIKIDPFFGESRNDPVELTLEFEGESGVYRYETHLKESGVIREDLSKRDADGEYQFLLRREWLEKKQAEVLKAYGIGLDEAAFQKHLQRGASVLSTALQAGNRELENVFKSLGPLGTNVDRLGSAKSSEGSNEVYHLLEATRFLQEDEEAFNRLRELLECADLGCDDLEFRIFKSQDSRLRKGKEFTLPFFNYVSEGRIFSISLLQEAAGTKRLFMTFTKLFQTLRAGGTAVIDELDVHPQVVPFLLKLFSDSKINPRNAQLIFSCAQPESVRSLEKSRIILIEKDDQFRSRACRMDRVSDPLGFEGRTAPEILLEE